jgi:hypothetical protein
MAKWSSLVGHLKTGQDFRFFMLVNLTPDEWKTKPIEIYHKNSSFGICQVVECMVIV